MSHQQDLFSVVNDSFYKFTLCVLILMNPQYLYKESYDGDL